MAVTPVKKSAFTSQVLQNIQVVMVDFYAVWCGPCKITEPIIEELSEELKDKVVFYKVDVDEDNDLAAQYNVFSIPTFIIFKNGKPVGQLVGAQSKDAFKAELSRITS